MSNIRQLNFAGGEISPALYGRVDVVKYQTGLRTCLNFIVMRHGGVENRAGTSFICAVKDSSKKVKLIPFVFNNEQTYVLEFGNLYMRVIKNGVQLGAPYEIVTPYLEADLPELQYIQSADIVTLVHPSYAPRELSRTGDTSWTLSTMTFGASIAAPTGLASNEAGTAYYYKVTAVSANSSEESLPSSAAGSSTKTSTLTWTAVTGAGYYNVYRALNDRYCWIGVADSTSFTDVSYTEELQDTPPIDRQLFNSSGNYPSAVAYYQQRFILANTDNNPEGVWTSKSALRKNFMTSTPLQDDDAVTFSIVGRQVNEIKHILDINRLIVFTTSGEWSISGDNAGILTPTGINPKQHTYNGSGSLPPIVVGGNALYVQSRGSVIRDLGYDYQSDGYKGNELTIFSSHLFDNYILKDWAYQQIPHSIVWCVRDDGTLLGLTYIREHQVFGWHRHSFDGTVENVCSVPEGKEDALYLVIKRTINGNTVRYIERMKSRQIIDIKDAVFVDSSLSYDGRNTTATTMTLSGGTTWTYDENLTLTASASSFTAADVGNEIVITGATGTIIRCRIGAYTSATVVTVKPHKTVPAAMRNTAFTVWSKAVDEVSGLSHLEGKQVSIFADGLVVASPNNTSYVTQTVSSGKVTLEKPYSVIHIGLPITADLETLNIDIQGVSSMADKKKNVQKLTMFVESSRGIFAGVDADNLTELKIRSDENYDEPVSLATGTVDINIKPEWNSSGKIMIRQTEPLPLSVLSIIPSGFVIT